MPFGGQLQRRRAALASWTALAVAVGGVITYAVQADGYQAHEADLNDGGIWVTSNKDGSYGRINKPIGELDGTVFTRLDSNLDIVQDGSSVVGIDLSDGVVLPLDPAQMQVADGEDASIPGSPDVGMAGGSLAVLDSVSGKLWVTREDPAVGVPAVSPLANQSDPVATVGGDAALAVSLDGSVYAVSAAAGELVTVRQSGDTGFAAPSTEKLPGDEFSDAIALTTVGAVPVVLDSASGRLAVIGGAEAEVPKGSVLQQPGPSASSVLVGARDGLLSVDLATGEVTTVAGDVAGEPAEPVRLGDCQYGAWAGGTGAVVTSCGGDEGTPQALDAQTSDLVFRVNRGQIVLNDRASGHVWDVDSDKPTQLDNWDAFHLRAKDKNDDDDQNQQDQGDRRPPKAKDDRLGARPGPHHDPAPARQRHRAVGPAAGDPLGARRRRGRRAAGDQPRRPDRPDHPAGRRDRRHQLRVLRRRRPPVGLGARHRPRRRRAVRRRELRAPPPRPLRAARLDGPGQRHDRRARARRLARPAGRRRGLHGGGASPVRGRRGSRRARHRRRRGPLPRARSRAGW